MRRSGFLNPSAIAFWRELGEIMSCRQMLDSLAAEHGFSVTHSEDVADILNATRYDNSLSLRPEGGQLRAHRGAGTSLARIYGLNGKIVGTLFGVNSTLRDYSRTTNPGIYFGHIGSPSKGYAEKVLIP